MLPLDAQQQVLPAIPAANPGTLLAIKFAG